MTPASSSPLSWYRGSREQRYCSAGISQHHRTSVLAAHACSHPRAEGRGNPPLRQEGAGTGICGGPKLPATLQRHCLRGRARPPVADGLQESAVLLKLTATCEPLRCAVADGSDAPDEALVRIISVSHLVVNRCPGPRGRQSQSPRARLVPPAARSRSLRVPACPPPYGTPRRHTDRSPGS